MSAVVCGADAAERTRANPKWKGLVHGLLAVSGIQLVVCDSPHRGRRISSRF